MNSEKVHLHVPPCVRCPHLPSNPAAFAYAYYRTCAAPWKSPTKNFSAWFPKTCITEMAFKTSGGFWFSPLSSKSWCLWSPAQKKKTAEIRPWWCHAPWKPSPNCYIPGGGPWKTFNQCDRPDPLQQPLLWRLVEPKASKKVALERGIAEKNNVLFWSKERRTQASPSPYNIHMRKEAMNLGRQDWCWVLTDKQRTMQYYAGFGLLDITLLACGFCPHWLLSHIKRWLAFQSRVDGLLAIFRFNNFIPGWLEQSRPGWLQPNRVATSVTQVLNVKQGVSFNSFILHKYKYK